MKFIKNNTAKTMARKDYDRIISTISSYKVFEETKEYYDISKAYWK